VIQVSQEAELRYVRNCTATHGGHVKKILGRGAAGLFIPAAIASAALFSPAVAVSDPASNNAINVVGESYAKAIGILKGQGVRGVFGGAVAGGTSGTLPQSQCIVSQQRLAAVSNVMYLTLDCTQSAAEHATDDTPATPAAPAPGPGGAAPAPGNGQGTYGGPIGVPVNVGG
jgi:hypothetical protein